MIKLVNEGSVCPEMLYNMKQYVSYGKNDKTSNTWEADVGTFAGNQYYYTKNCKELVEKLENAAFKS